MRTELRAGGKRRPRGSCASLIGHQMVMSGRCCAGTNCPQTLCSKEKEVILGKVAIGGHGHGSCDLIVSSVANVFLMI